MRTETWGEVKREWGYEVRVDFLTDSRIYHECFLFQEKPSSEALAAEIEKAKQQLEYAAPIAPPQFSVICENGVEVIV